MTNIFTLGIALSLAASMARADENASNPLASANNVDTRWQYTTADPRDKHDVFIDASHMLAPTVKLKYEVHYNYTDATGSDENDLEKLVIKPIYFPFQKKLNETWGMKGAVGFDLILEFENTDKGIGVGADQFAPLVGVAFNHFPTNWIFIPLLQHFMDFNGDTDISLTAARLIAIKPFGKGYWLKLDTKVPYDWENELWPITSEIQVGYNFGPSWALYADALVGIGSDRLFDAGVGIGLRFKY